MRKSKLIELKALVEDLKTIKKIKREDLKPNFLTTVVYDCVLNNGQTIRREEIIKNNQSGSAAVILPITKDGEVILTVQPRVSSDTTVGIGLPAGYIEPSELPLDAALRELREETGYTSQNLYEIASYYQDSGCSAAFNHAFIAEDCYQVAEQMLDDSEFIHYFMCTLEEAYELVDLGYINGSNSVLTLSKARERLRR